MRLPAMKKLRRVRAIIAGMSSQTMSPAPLYARLYLAEASVLGAFLVIAGLAQRLTAGYVEIGALTPVAPWLAMLGLSPLDVGWPMIVLGSTLIGSASGVYIGRRWAWQMAAVASLLALIYVWPGLVFGVVGLALLFTPPVRRFCVH